jgi:hypothetical protein
MHIPELRHGDDRHGLFNEFCCIIDGRLFGIFGILGTLTANDLSTSLFDVCLTFF